MNNSRTVKTLNPRAEKPFKGGLDCGQCQAELTDFIEIVLAKGSSPEDSPILLHLEGCPRCSQTYIYLIDLITAPQVKALQETPIDPGRSPDNLAGLLSLWQRQLAAGNRLEDLRGAAVGLSVIGMIRRQLDEMEEARLVHELALRTGQESGDLLSRAMSHADLGYLALARSQTKDAFDHLEAAGQYMDQLMDQEGKARVHFLLGEVGEQERDWARAQREYKAARAAATASNYALIADVVRQREQKATAILEVSRLIETLSAIAGEAGRPIQALRQTLAELEKPQRSFSEQLARLYRGWLQPRYGFAPGGERILVVNTAEEIPIQIVADPKVDREGHVALAITLNRAALAGLPEEFFIDLLFLPTHEALHTVRVGAEERLSLQAVSGLEFKAKLPGLPNFLDQLRAILDQEGQQRRHFPRTAFALRIWWEEEDLSKPATSSEGKES